MFSASQSCRFTAQVQHHRNSVTQLHSYSTARAAVFVVGVCMCVFCACMAGGSFPKQQQTWRQKLCRVLLCICVVVFFCNAGMHFVYFSKERKEERKPKQTSKPLQEVRFKASSKKKIICAMQMPDWITHHITVVALYVCVHACV